MNSVICRGCMAYFETGAQYFTVGTLNNQERSQLFKMFLTLVISLYPYQLSLSDLFSLQLCYKISNIS
jgi:hypothetical protein